jgi:hypothetical protein
VTVAFLSASAAGLTAASFSTRCAASANTCGERERQIGNGCVATNEASVPLNAHFHPVTLAQAAERAAKASAERELARCGISRQINNLAAPTKNEVNFLSHHAKTNRCRLFGESKGENTNARIK